MFKTVGEEPFQKLINKAGLWKSFHDWSFDEERIQDLTSNQVLSVTPENNKVFLKPGQLWRRRKFNETHFTLEFLSGSQALTKNLAGDFIEGTVVFN